jgi:hypothetical protein
MTRPFHATNKAGTCAWCGWRLRKEPHGNSLGGYGDGLFCGLNCGYRFAVAIARSGQRLQPKKEPPQERKPVRSRWPRCPECGTKYNGSCKVDRFAFDAEDGTQIFRCPDWIECGEESTFTEHRQEEEHRVVVTYTPKVVLRSQDT